MKNHFDFLIVGSGLYGSTFAYKAKQEGKRSLVIDRRPHLGGNVYCENIEGINVHKYGAHIFHTSNKEVWDFVNSIVPFNRYTNSPIANYRGRPYNLPFNMNTFYQMWGVLTPEEAQQKIEKQKAEALEQFIMHNPECVIEGKYEPQNLEEQALLLVGRDIYEVLIKEYTEKQWGRKCTELPAFVIKRLPVRFVHDNNYFNDKYQGIPIGGYNKLIEGLLDGVETMTGVDFIEERKKSNSPFSILNSQFDKIVYTGALDEYFDYRMGRLDWRTVIFEEEVLDTPNYQGNAVMNYIEREVPYTRVIEHKHFEMFGDEVYACPKTVISREYSIEYKEGMEPYYSVNDERNNSLAEKYRALASKEKNVIFGGRLAEYKYYDMHQIVEKALGFI
jgi:UDP-galactopyranose mutase